MAAPSEPSESSPLLLSRPRQNLVKLWLGLGSVRDVLRAAMQLGIASGQSALRSQRVARGCASPILQRSQRRLDVFGAGVIWGMRQAGASIAEIIEITLPRVRGSHGGRPTHCFKLLHTALQTVLQTSRLSLQIYKLLKGCSYLSITYIMSSGF